MGDNRVNLMDRVDCNVMSETYIAQSKSIAARKLGEEMMIMSAVDSTFFTLNRVATAIWQAADGKTPLSKIAASLCEEFDVSRAQALADAEQFVKELSPYGILLVSDQPLAAAS